MIAPRPDASSELLAGVIVTLFAITTLPAEPVDVVFKAKLDGTDQRYVVILPDEFDAGTPQSVLIALHGHGSDRWQFVKYGRAKFQNGHDLSRVASIIRRFIRTH